MTANNSPWRRTTLTAWMLTLMALAALLLSGCMMAAAPLLGMGKQESSGHTSSGNGQGAVAVYHPDDAKLTCEDAAGQLKVVWGQLAESEARVRGESPLAITRQSERPRLESLQKRYNRLLELAQQGQCPDWKDYVPMVVGETEGTERVGKAAQGARDKAPASTANPAP